MDHNNEDLRDEMSERITQPWLYNDSPTTHGCFRNPDYYQCALGSVFCALMTNPHTEKILLQDPLTTDLAAKYKENTVIKRYVVNFPMR